MIPLHNPFGPPRPIKDLEVVITSSAYDKAGVEYFGAIIVSNYRPDFISSPNVVVQPDISLIPRDSRQWKMLEKSLEVHQSKNPLLGKVKIDGEFSYTADPEFETPDGLPVAGAIIISLVELSY